VLHVNEQPVVPGRGREHACRRGAQMMHTKSERKSAGPQFPDRGILDKRHMLLP
jgi:hypothetical protein